MDKKGSLISKIFYPKKNLTSLFKIQFKNLLLIIFLSLLINSLGQKKVSVIVQGSGDQYFLGQYFYKDPTNVFVNGVGKCNGQKHCNFEEGLNNVTFEFNDYINSCKLMFYPLLNVIEIDLSNLDTSRVDTMHFMFSGCFNLKKITFGNINTNLVNDMFQMFFNCSKLKSIDLSNFETSSVTTFKEMFSHCESLTSIDVSKFNTENAIIMYDMFGYCYELTSINVSNFVTSKVTDFQGMFYRVNKLKNIDVSNFDTSSATNMKSMFSELNSLETLNISPLLIKDGVEFDWILGSAPDNLKICLIDLNTQLKLNTPKKHFDCSDNCFPKTYKYDLKDNVCIEYCNQSDYKYDYNNFCYDKCPNSTFEPDNNEYFCLNKISGDSYYFNTDKELFKKCYERCKICEQNGNEANNNCIECKDEFFFLNDSTDLTNNNCFVKCTYYYYFDTHNNYYCTGSNTCPGAFNKLIEEKKKCIDECKNDNIYRFEYNNTCYLQCPNGTNETEPFICTDIPEPPTTQLPTEPPTTQLPTDPPTTQLPTEAPTTQIPTEQPTTQLPTDAPTTHFLKESPTTQQNIIYQSESHSDETFDCFNTCQSCFDQGDEINNNCLECKDGYSFLDEFINKTNCYNECPYYYYFNELNQYLCTENEICPEHYDKFIPVYKKCIDECKKDRIYKYDYNNTCYEQCPNETNETEEYICIKDESGGHIVYQCSHSDPLASICSINSNNNTEIYDVIRNQILSEYSPDNNKSQIIEGVDNIIYQITTEKNEIELLKNGDLSDNYSLSIIDLGECESILKKEYGLNDDDTLIYLKKEKISDKSSDKDIEFEVYEPDNKTKLNLSLCYKTDINIYVKLEMSSETEALNEQLKELGYNMFDINDPFYQDICTPYQSSGKTDMILYDRIEDIYNNDDAQCQSNCQFSGYLFDSKYINCTCNVDIEEEKKLVKEEKFLPKKLYESFFEVLKYSNYKMLRCYKLIGNKRILTKNIGNIILIIFFIIYLISLICYIIKGVNPLKNKLNEIMIEEEKEKKIFNRGINIFPKKIDNKIKNEKIIYKGNKIKKR